MGAIQNALAAEPDRTKWPGIKARALGQLAGETFTRGPFTVTIDSIGATPGGNLELRVTVQRGGKTLPIDGHLIFVNPPILAPDGTFTGQVPNVSEQPRAVLRQLIVDAILSQRP